jgi:hypothetical protein
MDGRFRMFSTSGIVNVFSVMLMFNDTKGLIGSCK